ncbi:FUSC family protein [Streptomyces collinus]|nr:FUSC family protein [Streptomyces collinus]UJA15758.1 FUSC family protein [Streptomyces collinus]
MERIVDAVALHLRELAEEVRRSEHPSAVRTDLTGPSGSVPEPLRQEVAAERTITTPH